MGIQTTQVDFAGCNVPRRTLKWLTRAGMKWAPRQTLNIADTGWDEMGSEASTEHGARGRVRGWDGWDTRLLKGTTERHC